MVKVKFLKVLTLIVVFLLSAGASHAGDFKVTIKNLTNGIYFTPLLITAHDGRQNLFETGEPATEQLRAMAEGGDLSGLLEQLGGVDGDTIANPADGLLGPGESVQNVYLSPERRRNRYLSIVAMLLPTNDGFVGLDSLKIPAVPGTYRYYLYGYDAGTEANDEVITGGGAPGQPGIPADPGGNAGENGSGVIDFDYNTNVHIHRGIVGDDDPDGGGSDLNSAVHRWLHPVAELIIKIPRQRDK